jgi:hypothetical protein
VYPEANAIQVLPTSVRDQEWKRDVTMYICKSLLPPAATVIAHHFVPSDPNPPTGLLERIMKAHQVAVDTYGK